MDPLRVFLSSPGDVTDERNLARNLLKEELPYDPLLPGDVTFRVISWDDPAAPTPMLATLTPQEAVNRFGPNPSECDVVVVVLWSRLGSHLDLRTFKKLNGEPYRSGTEWEFEDARDADKRPAILVYRRTEIPEIKLNDPKWAERREQYDLVEQFFTNFKNQDGSFRGGFTSYEKPTEFKERLENDLKHLLRERFRRKLPDVDAAARAILSEPAWTKRPYPGLRPFTGEEAAIFFGRGREVDALISRLHDPTQRFLAIVGASGAGKSSLVHAGLLPRLADGAIEGSQHWRVLTFTPGAYGSDPLLALASKLELMLPVHKQMAPHRIAEALGEKPEWLPDHVDALLGEQSTGAVLVLVIDQFEELFTSAIEDNRKSFTKFLARAVADPRLRVIVTLRADFLPQCAAEPALVELLQAGTFPLGAPGPNALADMIRKPAERAGLEIETALIYEILRDAGSNPGEALPLIAFCLDELYGRTAPEHHLTLDAYQAAGGLRGAIGRRVDTLLEEVRSAEAADLNTVLAEVFRALVHVDAVGKEARQRAAQDELMVMTSPIPQLTQKLIHEHLLQAEEVEGRAVVMLAHEALIYEWPALKEWLKNIREELQRLQKAFEDLRSSAPSDRAHGAKRLGEIGLVKPEVMPALTAALGDDDAGVRQNAAAALAKLDRVTPEVVQTLIDALDDTDKSVRWWAAVALAKLGRMMPEVMQALITALAEAKKNAAFVLSKIEPVTPEVVQTLIAALDHPDDGVRSKAAEALGRIGSAAAAAVPALIAVLSAADDHNARGSATKALGQIGSAAVPALIAALDHPDDKVRRSAAEALGEIGPAAAAAVPALMNAAYANAHGSAAEALGRIDPAAKAALQAHITM